jgi:hypothetical protein
LPSPVRLPLVALPLLAAAVLAAPAGAATNKCARFTPKYSIAQQSRTAVVLERSDGIVYGCLFSDGRLRKLPGPDGTDTFTGYRYVLNGNLVGYGVSNLEPAATVATSAIYVVNLKTGQTVVKNQDAYPVDIGPEDEVSTTVTGLVVRPTGSIAWLVNVTGTIDENAVFRRQGTKMTTLDRGKDVRKDSFAASGNGATLYWTRGGTAKSATLS